MLKKLSIICAVCLAFIASASPIAKIPAKSGVVVYANVSDVIKYPLVQQFLGSVTLPPEISINDFEGKVALGFSFTGDIKKDKNLAFNVVYQTAKPTAGKLFNLLSADAMKSGGAKQFKVGGKPAFGDDDARAILVSPKEVILQVRSGKYKFVNLKKSKNLLTNRPEVKKSTIVIAIDTPAFASLVAKNLKPDVQEIKEVIAGQKLAIGSLKLNADGSLSFANQTLLADAAATQKVLALSKQSIEDLKKDPMAAAILEKVSVTSQGNTVTISGKFSAVEVQGAIAQIMMMVSKLNAPAQQAPAAPVAPGTAAK